MVVSTTPLPAAVVTGLSVIRVLTGFTGVDVASTGSWSPLLVERDVVHPEKHAARSTSPTKTHAYLQILMMCNIKITHI